MTDKSPLIALLQLNRYAVVNRTKRVMAEVAMGRVTKANLENAILEGVHSAFQTYEMASGGYWLWHAPESFMQASIFQKLSQLSPGFATLEASPTRIRMDLELKRDRRSDKMRDQQRFDILYWYANGMPRAIIEVKKVYSDLAKSIEDINRMRPWILNQSLNIEVGYFVAYTEASGVRAEQTINSRFARLGERAGAKVVTVNVAEARDDNGCAWGVGLLATSM